MKHTTGPWSVLVRGATIEVACKQGRLAEIYGSITTAKANAAIIAAAPELLEACKSLIDMITDNRLHGPEVYAACDVIAKAEGRES